MIDKKEKSAHGAATPMSICVDHELGEKYGNAGIEFCEMSEEQFNLIFPRLKDCEKKLKEEGKTDDGEK